MSLLLSTAFNMSTHTERVVLLVDMDCFYCQVEEQADPKLRGRPVAVVQYNQWRGGGIIAVNYVARDKGVTRYMRGEEAQRHCSDIQLVRVPNVRGKADLSKYRNAGKTVAAVLQRYTPLLERASVDEAYLDISALVIDRMRTTEQIEPSQLPNTHVVAHNIVNFLQDELSSEANLRLCQGAVIAEEIRSAVFRETGYTCSAGVAHNKILAKLACGLNKPNQQTILPMETVSTLYADLPIAKIRSLGGKFGSSLSEKLGISHMGELTKFGERELAKIYDEKTASFLYNIARGVDLEPVTTRLIPKSIGCCKQFQGKAALTSLDKIRHWFDELAQEVNERLIEDYEENNRKAKNMTVSFTYTVDGKQVSGSRTQPLVLYNAQRMVQGAVEVIKKNCYKANQLLPINLLGINVGKFEACKNLTAITTFFMPRDKTAQDVQASEKMETDASFSDSTIDLEEDFSEMATYEVESTSESDSISEEISKEDPEKSSFFLRYFRNMEEVKQESLPAKRDFDTSLSLNEAIEENEGERYDIIVCDKCNQSVLLDQVLSHNDYHYAQELLQEDKNQIRITTEQQKQTKQVPQPFSVKKNGIKRKSSNLDGAKAVVTLDRFFSPQQSSEKGETCPECNKVIHVDDFSSHLDYHAAKKLHLEINSSLALHTKKTDNCKKAKGLMAYFKARND